MVLNHVVSLNSMVDQDVVAGAARDQKRARSDGPDRERKLPGGSSTVPTVRVFRSLWPSFRPGCRAT